MAHDLLAIAIGLLTGATMVVAVSCIWVVLLIPARVQDRFQAASPRLLTWAMGLGLVLAALGDGVQFSLALPPWCAAVLFVPCGMFVGMLASALGEILEAAPVMMRRFRLGNASTGVRWVMLVGKCLGAVLASLIFTL